MKPNYYRIIMDCVEAGCRSGVNRARKHTDEPTYEDIEMHIENAIRMEIMEKFYFPEDFQQHETNNTEL